MAAPVQAYSGSATISGTEYSLPGAGTTLQTLAVAGVYTLLLDLAALTSTEQYELRLYESVRSGGTKRLVDSVLLSGAQAEPVYLYAPQLPLMFGWDMTLRLVSGTARVIEWSIRTTVDSDLATLVARLTSTRAGLLDNLDAAVSSRLATAGYTAPTAPPTAAAIRAEMDTNSTKLANLDAAVSSRLPASGYTAPDNAGIAGIKARTDNLPTSPASTGDVGAVAAAVDAIVADNFAAVPGAVRTALAPELARLDVAVSTREAEATAATRAATDQAEHDATQAAIAALASSSSGDPLANPTASYAAGTGGAALHRLNATPGTGPVVVVPTPPVADDLCRVYGTLVGLDGQPAADVSVIFTLTTDEPVTATQRLLVGRREIARTDGAGRLCNAAGDPFFDLKRTDKMSVPGVQYAISCARAGLQGRLVSLAAPMADLQALVV